MFVIIGFVVSMLCIFGVYIFHGGNIGVVLKALPFEMTTILGAAIGAFLINNQMKVVKASFKGLAGCFKGSRYTKARYMELMAMLYDILHALRLSCGGDTFEIISGYRSPVTNSMLRKTGGGGVAKRSLHMDGRAIDIRLIGVDTAHLRDAALALGVGGVGYYPESDFLHIDTGPVRSWGPKSA